MAGPANELEVEIDGECYALNKVPDGNSAVVLAEKEKLLGAIDLQSLVNGLSCVGGFIRVAYNRVGAAGPRYTENQIEIQRLGYDITKLCDKSALTVAKFKKTSSLVLIDLQSTYAYLLDNLEELAVDTFSAVSKLAGDMQKAALDLSKEFEEERKMVIKVLEKTQVATKNSALQIEEEKKKLIEMEEKQQLEAQLVEERRQKEREAENRRRDLEQQEDKAISEIGDINPFIAIINCVTSKFTGQTMFSTDDAEKKVEALRKLRLEVLETEQTIREKRYEALERMSSFAAKIKQCNEDQDMTECAIEALHEAVGALKHLSDVMLQAAHFWEQMKDHCHSLAEHDMKSQVEKVLRLDEKKRHKVWTSDSFKQEAVRFYAGWVALNEVCSTYLFRIKITQKDLHRYITENPTWEQSRKNTQVLADQILRDLRSDKLELRDKNFEAQEKMKALESKDQQEEALPEHLKQ